MIAIGRYSRLRNELIKNIDSQIKYGHSKHQDKIKARNEARKKGERVTMIHGIYSFTTRKTYVGEVERFAAWAVSRYKCKNAKSAKQYVRNYLKYCIEKELSPWTIQTRAYSLACAFKCPVNDFGVELPKRERKYIKRSRLHTKSDEETKNQKHERIREFARAIGARRGGMVKLRADDIRVRDDGGYEVHLLEKGGKHRWARVNPYREDIAREFFDEAKARGEHALLFPDGIAKRLDIHACRAEYARDMYAIYESEGCGNNQKYICRNERKGDIYDKGVLMCVSKDLGHSRCDVVVDHYMR